MATIVSIHSFRGGTGKSNTTANVATIRAQSSEIIGSDYVKDLKVRAGELRRMVADDEGRADG